MIPDWIIVPICAVLFRLRGSSVIGSTIAGRALWSLGTAFSLVALADELPPPLVETTVTWSWLIVVGATVSLFAGTVVGQFGSIDMGTNEGTLRGDFLRMLLRGVLWVIPLAGFLYLVGFSLFGVLTLVLAGATAPVWYVVGHYGPVPKRGATPFAETALGASIGTGIYYLIQTV